MAPLAFAFLLAFVFLIVVVLMSLLNGLAVSDTGLIQAKAEIVGYVSRVETISYTESVLLGERENELLALSASLRRRGCGHRGNLCKDSASCTSSTRCLFLIHTSPYKKNVKLKRWQQRLLFQGPNDLD